MGKRRGRYKKVLDSLTIEDLSAEGKGVARHEGKVYFVQGGIPGDVADVVVNRDKKDFGEGKIGTLHKPSEHRKEAFCMHFGLCGGCKWQHLDYSQQLIFKENIVAQAFQRIGKLEFPPILPIMGCEETTYFRNKLEFTFTSKRWLEKREVENEERLAHRNGLGFFVPGHYDKVVSVEHCHLEPDPSNQIRNAVLQYCIEKELSFYDLYKKQGLLRNLMIRVASTGEVLVLLVAYEDNADVQGVLDFIQSEFPQITSLHFIANDKVNDTYYDREVRLVSGKPYIEEQLGHCRFRIGPKSFFQTNSRQAKLLYDKVVELADLKGDEVVYDLYSGVGSISIYLADKCKSVLGIEEVVAAVADARANAGLNEAANCEFIDGDVRKILDASVLERYGKPDVIVTDPPRAGMHPDVVETLLEAEAERIIYVSCNPSTQARDLQKLAEKYRIETVQPVDMFPHTPHIENICAMRLK